MMENTLGLVPGRMRGGTVRGGVTRATVDRGLAAVSAAPCSAAIDSVVASTTPTETAAKRRAGDMVILVVAVFEPVLAICRFVYRTTGSPTVTMKLSSELDKTKESFIYHNDTNMGSGGAAELLLARAGPAGSK